MGRQRAGAGKKLAVLCEIAFDALGRGLCADVQGVFSDTCPGEQGGAESMYMSGKNDKTSD